MRKSKIVYNPLVSVAENAVNNGVTESAVRWYIRTNGIDRKRDNVIVIKRAIGELVKKHPSITTREISERLNLSLNTVKKYLNSDIDMSRNGSLKLSIFDTSKQKFLISSVSDRQDEILNNILRLYIMSGVFDCDVTYSTGGFYKHIPQPLMKFDKYPMSDEVKPLSSFYEIENDSLSSIVMDLPFIVRNGGDGSVNSCKVANRFNCFDSTEELYKVNNDMIELCWSKLSKKGFLIVKTMDVLYAGKQHWVANFVMNKCFSLGFEMVDMFILLAKSKLLRSDRCVQHHSRKFHSYFLVFRKKKSVHKNIQK